MKTSWNKLKDKKPSIEHDGKKILLFRVLNEGQEEQNPSIFPTHMIHLCNPNETWWMKLPDNPFEVVP